LVWIFGTGVCFLLRRSRHVSVVPEKNQRTAPCLPMPYSLALRRHWSKGLIGPPIMPARELLRWTAAICSGRIQDFTIPRSCRTSPSLRGEALGFEFCVSRDATLWMHVLTFGELVLKVAGSLWCGSLDFGILAIVQDNTGTAEKTSCSYEPHITRHMRRWKATSMRHSKMQLIWEG